jgi:hypothetical protein
MASSYSVTINIATDTLQSLAAGGFQLYAFKAVQGPPGGVPVVWFSTTQFSSRTVVAWTEDYFAYTANSVQLAPNTVVSASSTCPIDLGELAQVGDGGLLTPVEGQDPNSISILNATLDGYICGLAQQANGSPTFNPMCAFPLLPGTQDEIVPIERVFLMFATTTVDTGTVLEQAFGYGVLIDVTAPRDVTLAYDLTAVIGGWAPAPGVYPQLPNTALAPLLISPSAGARTRAASKQAELAAV